MEKPPTLRTIPNVRNVGRRLGNPDDSPNSGGVARQCPIGYPVNEVASAGGVVKTGGILEYQEPNIVWDHGRNRFQFLPVGSNNVSWLRWCAG
jgi:hypothetical protein